MSVILYDLEACIDDIHMLERSIELAKGMTANKRFNVIETENADGVPDSFPIPKDLEAEVSKILTEYFKEEKAETVKKFEKLCEQFISEQLN